MGAATMTGKLGAACPKCGKPVLAAKGGRHLSCSPICTSCHLPIAGDDPNQRGPRHADCEKKRR
ncbi:hypothetical protein SEA_LENNON_77 [Gordonia phage Lennon]|uniref:DNA binding protein n=1 Tax=Gordonia phage Lennon TaxID=2041512 RepID=A0A2D1GEX3_9CAUD|nr:hypothetical protein FDI74_gp77 [Gordonia phage Lennon]ATN90270.1 hypothetical protein SEA_LENNON_77 [Gordonia phage Lennon]